MSEIKICTEMALPSELLEEANRLAVEENPANAHQPIGADASRAAVPEIIPPPSIALITGKLWQPGRTLRVGFLDGEAAVQNKVVQYALEWARHTNIKFDFGSASDAEIRISFSRGGSWSYLGTDALVIDRNEPTMNFGWFTTATSDREFSRTTIHEFGHALACIHEHQHPDAGIPWDKPAVYRYYANTNGWDKAQVDNNIFAKYDSRDLTNSAYDSKSIMHYSVPNELTIGDWEVGWNTVLSATDQAFIRGVYPFGSRRVGLQATNEQYICAEGGGGREVVANRDRLLRWETFDLIELGGNKIGLKAANGQYVCAEGGGGREVVANRDRLLSWETFDLIELGDNKIGLKAANGQYVCAEGGGGREVVANRDRLLSWETFDLIAV